MLTYVKSIYLMSYYYVMTIIPWIKVWIESALLGWSSTTFWVLEFVWTDFGSNCILLGTSRFDWILGHCSKSEAGCIGMALWRSAPYGEPIFAINSLALTMWWNSLIWSSLESCVWIINESIALSCFYETESVEFRATKCAGNDVRKAMAAGPWCFPDRQACRPPYQSGPEGQALRVIFFVMK